MGYEERRRLGDVRRINDHYTNKNINDHYKNKNINDHYTDKGISNKKEVRSPNRTSYWSCNDH